MGKLRQSAGAHIAKLSGGGGGGVRVCKMFGTDLHRSLYYSKTTLV